MLANIEQYMIVLYYHLYLYQPKKKKQFLYLKKNDINVNEKLSINKQLCLVTKKKGIFFILKEVADFFMVL